MPLATRNIEKSISSRDTSPGSCVSSCFQSFFVLREVEKSLQVIFSFPSKHHLLQAKYPGVDRFCFPTQDCSCGDCGFVFVLTNDNGQRVYGHCFRTVVGEAFVFVSQHAWVHVFQRIIYLYRVNGPSHGKLLIEKLYSMHVPHPGEAFGCTFGGTLLHRPQDANNFFFDTEPMQLLDMFDVDSLLQVVSSLLLEQHIAVIGPNFGVVSRVILALQALLHPLEWHHILVTVTTNALLDVLSAPTPYLVGLLHSHRPRVERVPIESLVVVDLSQDGMKCNSVTHLGEEKLPLPRSRSLKIALMVLQAVSSSKKNSESSSLSWRNETTRLLCSLFFRYYAEILGAVAAVEDYREYFQSSLKHSNAKERRFFALIVQSQALDTLQQQMLSYIDTDRWEGDPFCVLCVQLHTPSYSKRFYKEAVKERRATKADDDVGKEILLDQEEAMQSWIRSVGTPSIACGGLAFLALRKLMYHASCSGCNNEGEV